MFGEKTGGWRGQSPAVDILPTTGSHLAGIADRPDKVEPEISKRTASAQSGEMARESTIEVPLSEEEVKVGKRTVGAGEVKLHKTITTEQVKRACRAEARRYCY